MKTYHPPSGLQRGLELLIDPDWSPEQALAVTELLDDLRDRIWAHYEFALLNKYRQKHDTHADVEITVKLSPFDGRQEVRCGRKLSTVARVRRL